MDKQKSEIEKLKKVINLMSTHIVGIKGMSTYCPYKDEKEKCSLRKSCKECVKKWFYEKSS